MTMTSKIRLRTYTVKRDPSASMVCERPVRGPDDMLPIIRAVFEALDADREHFVVFAMNVRGQITGYKVIATGTQTACLVHPREVFHAAITLSACSVLLAHNHPSGISAPSPEDETLAVRMRDAGELLGITVQDQFIVAEDRIRSVGAP